MLSRSDTRVLAKRMSTTSWQVKHIIIGTGRLVAMVGTADAPVGDIRNLQILFGLVLAITPRSSKNKNELPATRIHRQCNRRAIEIAFLSMPAINFFV